MLYRHILTPQYFQHFALRGILLRHFTQPQSLRFGLPASEADWQRLRLALGELPGSKA